MAVYVVVIPWSSGAGMKAFPLVAICTSGKDVGGHDNGRVTCRVDGDILEDGEGTVSTMMSDIGPVSSGSMLQWR